MKIAITAKEARRDAEVDPRFGRAACFVIHDTETNTSTIVDNAPAIKAAHGAGLQAAENVARAGATVVLTGSCGPKASDALAAANIKVEEGHSGTVPDALHAYLVGAAT